jgi:hypothetical protein
MLPSGARLGGEGLVELHLYLDQLALIFEFHQ